MSDELVKGLLTAIEIAAFVRVPDGSFLPVAPAPAWFGRLAADGTFPFLGHILEEAIGFWQTRQPTRREWGPCAEVDEAGREFHYKVTAVTVKDRQYLLFQLDPASDEARLVLQKVRAQMLAAEQRAGAGGAIAAAQREVRRAAGELRDFLLRLPGTASAPSGFELGETLSARCDDLLKRVDTLVRASASPAQPPQS
jgi:hypothetical protein